MEIKLKKIVDYLRTATMFSLGYGLLNTRYGYIRTLTSNLNGLNKYGGCHNVQLNELSRSIS